MTPPTSLPKWRKRAQALSFLLFIGLLTMTVWPLGRVFLGAFLASDPLIAANSAAAGVAFWPFVLVAALVALSPLVVGRAFCGWACPMGALVEWTVPSAGHGRLSQRALGRLRAMPNYVLIAVVASILFASGTFLLLDPLSTLTRSATLLLYPLLDRVIRLAGDVLYLIPALRPVVDVTTGWLDGRLVFMQPLVYALSFGVLAWLIGLLALSLVEPRMWCRHLCPLGALLGFVGRFAVFGRVVDTSTCIQCGRCDRVCPMDACRDGYHATDTTRCELGFECADVCPAGAISFGVRPRKDNHSPERRHALVAGSIALLGGFFAYTGLRRREPDVHLVRPPGSRAEDDFLALCARCGQCMKVCPTNVLQPSVTEAGLEGVFTPRMDYRNGYCEWSCNECGKVCPTGAIHALRLTQKHRTKVGRAYIDRSRCIPWADGKSCLVCQELCPVSPKAISIETAELTTPLGKRVKLGRPQVIEELCIGCGICQHNCPVPGEAAIVVRSRRTDGRSPQS